MAEIGKVYINTIGSVVLIEMEQPINDVTDKIIYVLKAGTEITWIPEVYEDIYLKYIIVAGDLDVAGTYYLRPHLTFSDGWSGSCDTVSFDVYDEYR